MIVDVQLEKIVTTAAEEVLRLVYGDDLAGCAVRLDDVSDIIRKAIEDNETVHHELAGLHSKAFEAVQLLSTPPADGHALSPEDLRSVLSDRLDQIQALATRVLSATKSET
jgi:hypothetical protein